MSLPEKNIHVRQKAIGVCVDAGEDSVQISTLHSNDGMSHIDIRIGRAEGALEPHSAQCEISARGNMYPRDAGFITNEGSAELVRDFFFESENITVKKSDLISIVEIISLWDTNRNFGEAVFSPIPGQSLSFHMEMPEDMVCDIDTGPTHQIWRSE